MNPLLILFLLFCLAIGACVWRSCSRPTETLGGHRRAYQTEDAAQQATGAIHRLFSDADRTMAEAAGKKVARRLKTNRRHALRLYLRQMRADFRNASRVARDAAAHSESPDAAFRILKLTIEFYGLQAALYTQNVLGLRLVDPSALLPRVSVLRQLS